LFVKKILAHFNGSISGKHFAVWGLAFKPNTDDVREAPSIKIINKLLEGKASITAYDPEAVNTAKKILGDRICYSEHSYEALKDADALVIVTEWNEFRNPSFDKIKSLLKQPVIFDGRNVYDVQRMQEMKFIYYSVGRAPVVK